MSLATKLAQTLAFGTLVVLAGCAAPGSPDLDAEVAPPATKPYLEVVPMVTHVAFGVFEMDVFIERATEPGKAYRPTPAEASSPVTRDAPLYTTASETPHDPTFTNAGPFEKGPALNMDLGDWIAATGAAAYLCDDGADAALDASFSRLVPNGVYTFWNARLDFTDGAITGGEDIPMGAADGSQSAFRADAHGNARLSVSWTGCNAASTAGPGIGPTGFARVFAIAYHSDGQTYGATPGPFGKSSHVQLFGIVKGG